MKTSLILLLVAVCSVLADDVQPETDNNANQGKHSLFGGLFGGAKAMIQAKQGLIGKTLSMINTTVHDTTDFANSAVGEVIGLGQKAVNTGGDVTKGALGLSKKVVGDVTGIFNGIPGLGSIASSANGLVQSGLDAGSKAVDTATTAANAGLTLGGVATVAALGGVGTITSKTTGALNAGENAMANLAMGGVDKMAGGVSAAMKGMGGAISGMGNRITNAAN